MRVEVNLKDQVLSNFANQIGAVGEEKGRHAMARAVNRVTRTVEGRVARAVAKQSSIPAYIIRTQIGRKLAAHKGDGPLEGVVYATGSPLPLKVFNPKQFSWGVRAKVWVRWSAFLRILCMAGAGIRGSSLPAAMSLQGRRPTACRSRSNSGHPFPRRWCAMKLRASSIILFRPCYQSASRTNSPACSPDRYHDRAIGPRRAAL